MSATSAVVINDKEQKAELRKFIHIKGARSNNLKDIELFIQKNKLVVVTGVSGSGKSTLLQLIAGTLTPNEGELAINGRVAALLELGSGFHPEFTGWENVRLQASILGLTEDEIAERTEPIARFSELGDALDRPLRTYSSGMILRLGFSIAVSIDPDILLVDEALAVGDLTFQQKCMGRIQEMREQGVTILLVTHDLNATKRLCDEVHVLEKGQLVQSGPTEAACNWYVARLFAQRNDVPDVETSKSYRHGNKQATIERWQWLDEQGTPSNLGWIGREYTVDAYGFRDRSWGLRSQFGPGIVPKGPLLDLMVPHGRERLTV